MAQHDATPTADEADTRQQPARSHTPAFETYGTPHEGEATYYRATGEGNCSFAAANDLMVTAVNSKDYDASRLCGAFIRVTGPEGEVTVRIVDRCPGCREGGIDLSREAFAQISSHEKGRVPVTWQIIAGPVEGPIAYHYMDGTTRYWLAIQIRNHRWPISTLEIMPNGTSEWIPVERRSYNYFVKPKPIAAGPLRVRITSVTGASLEDVLPEPDGERLIQGSAQF